MAFAHAVVVAAAADVEGQAVAFVDSTPIETFDRPACSPRHGVMCDLA